MAWGVLLVLAGCVRAAPPSEITALVNARTHDCLVAAPGGIVRSVRCSGAGDLQWVVGRGPVVTNTITGACLNVATDREVRLTACVSRGGQRWARGPVSSLRSVATGGCLTERVVVAVCDGTDSQRWDAVTLTPVR